MFCFCTCFLMRTQNIKNVKDYKGFAFEDTIEVVIHQIQQQAITNKMLVRCKG